MSHARLGFLARWYCTGCTANWFQGRFACRFCCGYTASAGNVVRGVRTAHGQPAARCLP